MPFCLSCQQTCASVKNCDLSTAAIYDRDKSEFWDCSFTTKLTISKLLNHFKSKMDYWILFKVFLVDGQFYLAKYENMLGNSYKMITANKGEMELFSRLFSIFVQISRVARLLATDSLQLRTGVFWWSVQAFRLTFLWYCKWIQRV